MFYTGTFDFNDIANIKKDIEEQEVKFADNLLKVATQIEDDYLPLLQNEPQQRAVHPFQFASPKSRRKYFAMIANGEVEVDDYGYVRNGGYAKSWIVDLEQNGTEYTLSVYSTFPAAQYVGGLRQVQGHANTGWIQYQPILSDISTFLDSVITRLV